MKNLKGLSSEIENWDYNQSVETYSKKLNKWKKLSLEIVREVYIAQQYFTKFGIESRKNHLKEGNSPKLSNDNYGKTVAEKDGISFLSYLKEIGLPYKTAYRWLDRYIPEENRLLEIEEVKAIERQKKEAEEQRRRDMIAEYQLTSIKPEGWDEKTQEMYDTIYQLECCDLESELIQAKRASWAHIFESKKKRKAEYWNRQEIGAFAVTDFEPVRSLAKQVELNHITRSQVAEALFEIEKKVATINTPEMAEAKAQIQNLRIVLGDIE